MSNYNISKYLTLSLMTMLIGAMEETSYGTADCWKQSRAELTEEEWGECPNQVGSGLPCIELEDEFGVVYATDCCSEYPVACDNVCAAESEPGPRPLQFRVDLLPEQPLKDATEIYHISPRVPISVDHIPVSPEDIGQFDGMPLYYLVCQTNIGRVESHAFMERTGLADQLQECVLGEPSFVVREAPEKATEGIVFYEGRRGEGASYFLPSGQLITLDGTWWDDRITSLRGFDNATFVTFFENADFSGSSLTMATDIYWSDLGAFGWDGRASAVFVWPLLAYTKPLQKLETDE